MFEKIKKIRYIDILDLIKIMISFVPGKILKFFSKEKIILISERKDDAKDNGYWYFKYVRENYPEIKAFYPINKKTRDYSKIKELGHIVSFGSISHHILFWACTVHVSAHIGNGLPSHRVGFNLLKMGFYNNKNIFIQHGIVKHKLPFLDNSKTKLDLLTATTSEEAKFIREAFRYPEDKVKVTGMARYDNLIDRSTGNNILIMPTWRIWLYKKPQDSEKEFEAKFLSSSFYQEYSKLINSESLIKYIQEKNIKITFCLHNDLQQYRHLFSSRSSNIIIVNISEVDLQKKMCEASLLVTDYSSVSYDFSYMNKPVLFYKFDSKMYYEYQYPLGEWPGGDDQKFGKVVKNHNSLIKELINLIENDYDNTKYILSFKDFYDYKDKNNCKRIHKEVMNIAR